MTPKGSREDRRSLLAASMTPTCLRPLCNALWWRGHRARISYKGCVAITRSAWRLQITTVRMPFAARRTVLRNSYDCHTPPTRRSTYDGACGIMLRAIRRTRLIASLPHATAKAANPYWAPARYSRKSQPTIQRTYGRGDLSGQRSIPLLSCSNNSSTQWRASRTVSKVVFHVEAVSASSRSDLIFVAVARAVALCSDT